MGLRFTCAALGLALALAGCGNGRAGDIDAGAGDVSVTPPDSSVSDASIDAPPGDAVAPGRAYEMPRCDRPTSGHRPLSTRCQHVVDANGRVVVLHGINARVAGVFDVTFDDGRVALETIPEFSLEDARRMRAMGFNLLRLPINWSGLEPTAIGGISTAYLDRIARVADVCQAAGLYLLIDFHQDAYSKEIGEDGAPYWAISPEPERRLQGPLRDLGARRASSQVLSAFATFFGDEGAGPMLRTRFAQAARAVARRFASHPAVVGYELYNEPVTGDAELLRLHTEVGRAIREGDPLRLLFFEPPGARNITDRALVSPEPFPLTGAVYSPHIYTVAFTPGDSPLRSSFTRDTLRTSYVNAVREANAWGAALYVTEFGYDPAGVRSDEYFNWQGSLQDEFGVGAAFWLWKERSQDSWGMFGFDESTQQWSERDVMRRAVTRVWPEVIAGWPVRWGYDRSAMRFELRYQGSIEATGPNLIYLPGDGDFSPSFSVTCDGTDVPVERDPDTGLISVPCLGATMHTVLVTAR